MKCFGYLLTVLFVFSITNSFSQEKKKPLPMVTNTEIWIDRFDNTDGTCLTGGYWFSFDDKANNGLSKITPAEIRKFYLPIIERNNNTAFSADFSLHQGSYKWDPYVGFGVNVIDSTISVSLEKIQGIAYEFKGARHYFTYQLSTVKDYAHYRRMVPESEEWKIMIIPISELRQPNTWGKPVEFDATMIQALIWNIIGKTGDSGTLSIDNVRLLRKLPKEEVVKVESVKPAEVRKVTAGSSRVVSDKIKIANWYKDYKAAYSLSFDDGLISHYKYVFPLLSKYDVSATFYIVSESLEEDSLKTPSWRYGYWYQFLKMYDQGQELASHSATHPKLTGVLDGSENERGTLQYELSAPVKTMQKKIPGYTSVTFAYPFVDFNNHVSDECEKKYYSARGLGSGFNPTTPSQWMNLQSHGVSYHGLRTMETDKAKILELESWISANTIARKGWSILMAHDVFPFEEALKAADSWHPMSLESLEVFVVWLKEKQKSKELWVETVGNVTRYVKERDAVSIVLKEETKDKWIFSIKDNLPDEVFNFPLTIEVTLPLDWNKVEAKQGDKVLEISKLEGKIQLEVIPDKGDVVMSKGE